MSDKQAWRCPPWMAAEDVERYERLVESLHDTVRAVRAAADRLTTAADVSGWQARVNAVSRDADEWTIRLNKLARREEAPGTPQDQGEAA